MTTHIRHTREDLKKYAWCGVRLGPEFAFIGIDHAANTRMWGSALVPCSSCVNAACSTLQGIWTSDKGKPVFSPEEP